MDAGDLVYLFQEASDRRADERRAFSEYGGYSWGYAGANLIEAAQKAEDALQKGLEQFVDERIAAKLGEADRGRRSRGCCENTRPLIVQKACSVSQFGVMVLDVKTLAEGGQQSQHGPTPPAD